MEITDRQLITISLVVAFSGLLLLFIAQLLLNNTPVTPAEFMSVPEKTVVVLDGKIESMRIIGNVTQIQMQTSCSIPLVIFEPKELEEGAAIRVKGQKQFYKGEPQISVSSLTRLVPTVEGK